jgi:hypothetical protein
MKKIFRLMILNIIIIAVLTACGGNSSNEDTSNTDANGTVLDEKNDGGTNSEKENESTSGVTDTDKKEDSDKHYYRTVKVIAFADAMMPSMSGLLESDFGFGEYLPTITFTYNTQTGMVESAMYSTYYATGEYGDEELQRDIEALSGDGEFCSRFSGFRTEDLDEVTELSFDIDISTYFTYFDPIINLCFVEREQDIEGYKDMVYYSRLNNYYDPKPTCEDGEGYFYDQISCRRIEWKD